MNKENELLVDIDVFDERIARFEHSCDSFDILFSKINNLLDTMLKNEWQGNAAEAFGKKTENVIRAMNGNRIQLREFIAEIKKVRAEYSDTEDYLESVSAALDDSDLFV